jgi:autotransporter-associated beta strand protein
MLKARMSRAAALRLLLIALIAIVPITWALWVAHAASRTWTGSAGAPIFNWTAPTNWKDGLVPQTGDSLIFPVVQQTIMNNDYPNNTSFASMTFSGAGYNLAGGSGVTLTGGTAIGSTGSGTNIIQIPINVPFESFLISGSASSTLILTNTIKTDSGLILLGAGAIRILGVISGADVQATGTGLTTFTANNTYTGPTIIKNGTMIINGSQPQSDISIDLSGTLGGTGRVGSISVDNGNGGGTISPGDVTHATGFLTE